MKNEELLLETDSELYCSYDKQFNKLMKLSGSKLIKELEDISCAWILIMLRYCWTRITNLDKEIERLKFCDLYSKDASLLMNDMQYELNNLKRENANLKHDNKILEFTLKERDC